MKLITRTLGTAGATVALAGAGVVIAGSASAADTGIPVLEAIKQCESGGSYTAQNPTSTASGAYQFLDSTWQGMDAAAGYARAVDAPESVQDAAAIELYTEQGTTPWLASASCWQGMGLESTRGSGETATATDTTSADTGTAAGTATASAPRRSSGSRTICGRVVGMGSPAVAGMLWAAGRAGHGRGNDALTQPVGRAS